MLPELERMVVFEHQWISSEKFVHAYVIGQFLPGPNMAMCPIVGYWVNGLPGFFAAFAGIYIPPLIMMTLGFWLYGRGRKHEAVRRAEKSIRPVILGLLLASGFRLWWVQMHEELIWLQLSSFLLIGLGAFFYSRKKVGPLTAIFVTGLIWYALHLGGQIA